MSYITDTAPEDFDDQEELDGAETFLDSSRFSYVQYHRDLAERFGFEPLYEKIGRFEFVSKEEDVDALRHKLGQSHDAQAKDLEFKCNNRRGIFYHFPEYQRMLTARGLKTGLQLGVGDVLVMRVTFDIPVDVDDPLAQDAFVESALEQSTLNQHMQLCDRRTDFTPNMRPLRRYWTYNEILTVKSIFS